MGVPVSNWRSTKKQVIRLLIFLLVVLLSLQWFLLPCSAGESNANNTNAPPLANDAPPPDPHFRQRTAPFRPGIAVIVATLTTVFSITFLLLVYAKHCKNFGRHPDNQVVSLYGNGVGPTSRRKNSGIDRAVVESLPVFRFGSLTGQKEGLECAVCLNVFETNEVLRLLPKCKHAFHVECVDTWLDGHSTCPLCRYRVDPEDVLLIFDHLPARTNPNELEVGELEREGGTRRVSGRHSFDGVRQRERGTALFSFRMSLDGLGWRRSSGGARNEPATIGCFERYQRKDGSLLTRNEGEVSMKGVNGGNQVEKQKEGEAAIVVDGGGEAVVGSLEGGKRTKWEHTINVVGMRERWSDVQPSDLRLCLRTDMLVVSPASLLGFSITHKGRGMGGRVINDRSVSEITGYGRFSTSGRVGWGGAERSRHGRREQHEVRTAGVVSKWLGRVSSSPDVSDCVPAGQSLA